MIWFRVEFFGPDGLDRIRVKATDRVAAKAIAARHLGALVHILGAARDEW
jgi:hypothetical protein